MIEGFLASCTWFFIFNNQLKTFLLLSDLAAFCPPMAITMISRSALFPPSLIAKHSLFVQPASIGMSPFTELPAAPLFNGLIARWSTDNQLSQGPWNVAADSGNSAVHSSQMPRGEMPFQMQAFSNLPIDFIFWQRLRAPTEYDSAILSSFMRPVTLNLTFPYKTRSYSIPSLWGAWKIPISFPRSFWPYLFRLSSGSKECFFIRSRCVCSPFSTLLTE